MKFKRIQLSCSLMVVILLLFSTMASAKTEVTFWHMETPPWRVEVFQQLIDEFNAQNPDIDVTQQVTSWAEAYTKVFSATRAKSLPDFSFATPDYAITLYDAGILQPVDNIVACIDSKYRYIPATLDQYYYEDNYWGVPTWGMNIMMFYREDMLQAVGYSEMPDTWDEFLVVVEALTEGGVCGIGLPKAKNLWGDQVVWSFMSTNNGRLFDENGELDFNNPETVETFEYLQKLSRFSPPDATSWAWGEGQIAFTGGKIAILPIFGGMRNWEDAPEMSVNVKAAPIPKPTRESEAGTYSAVNGVVVFTADKEKQAAIGKFLEFLMEPERNGYWLSSMEPGTYIPITEEGTKAETYWKHPIIDKHSDAIRTNIKAQETGKLFGFVNKPSPAIGAIIGANVISAAAQKVYFDEMTPAQAVEWAEQEMSSLID